MWRVYIMCTYRAWDAHWGAPLAKLHNQRCGMQIKWPSRHWCCCTMHTCSGWFGAHSL